MGDAKAVAKADAPAEAVRQLPESPETGAMSAPSDLISVIRRQDLVRLQRTAGNRAVSSMIQATGPATGPRAPRFEQSPTVNDQGGRRSFPHPRLLQGLIVVQRDSPPDVPATRDEAEQTVDEGQEALERVPHMEETDLRLLAEAIPGADAFLAIEERDKKWVRLQDKVEEAERLMPGMVEGTPTFHYLSTVLGPEIKRLMTEIDALDKRVKVILNELRCDERGLVQLVTEDFPAMFEERAKDVALDQLNHNEEIAEGEKERTGAREDRAGVRAAAIELSAIVAEIESLQGEVATAPYLPDSADPQKREEEMKKELLAKKQELKEKRATFGLEYPILYREDLDLKALAGSSDEQLQEMIGGKVDDILSNIRETRDNIAHDSLSIWTLPTIVKLTMRSMAIKPDSALAVVVNRQMENAKAIEALLTIAVAALSMTTGILGAAVGAVAGARTVLKYLEESAASDVGLEPEVSKLTEEDPSAAWLILALVDIMGGAAAVRGALKVVRGPALAVKAGEIEKLGELKSAATAAGMTPQKASQLVGQAAIGGAASRGVRVTLDEIRAVFRNADPGSVFPKIKVVFEKAAERVVAENRVVSLLAEPKAMYQGILVKIVGAGKATVKDKVLAQRIFDSLQKASTMGVYDPVTRKIFLKGEATAGTVASFLSHEMVHRIQDWDTGLQNMLQYEIEFQAYVAQREFVHLLPAEMIDDDLAWLLKATYKDIEDHVLAAYPNSFKPLGFNEEESVRRVMEQLERFAGVGP